MLQSKLNRSTIIGDVFNIRRGSYLLMKLPLRIAVSHTQEATITVTLHSGYQEDSSGSW